MESNLLRKIDRMNELIRRASTGPPAEFAEKMKISESTLYNYLNFLKYELNAPISYCRYRKTYYYDKKGNIIMMFTSLDRREILKISS